MMTQDEFDKWLTDNNHIWRAFENEALKVVRAGYEHYSAKTIIEFLRHHTAIKEGSGEWKINNDATSHLARLFAKKHPIYAHLFEFRGRK